MKLRYLLVASLAASVATLSACATTTAGNSSENSMSFFIVSANPGKGADLGGIVGADAYCATLAKAAGVAGKTWKAYLSTSDKMHVTELVQDPGLMPMV